MYGSLFCFSKTLPHDSINQSSVAISSHDQKNRIGAEAPTSIAYNFDRLEKDAMVAGATP